MEEVLERRLNKDMTYEFKVRFKGYGPDDDMWLPASAFKRSVAFESTSRFGRKRKHKTEESITGESSKRIKTGDSTGTHHSIDEEKSTKRSETLSTERQRTKWPSKKKKSFS